MSSVSNSPSVDIIDMLIDSGCPVSSLVFGTDLFVASLPDTPNNAVCIYDTGGSAQGEFGYEYPNVQIIIRNLDYVTGYVLARNIKYYLHLARNNEIWNGTRYININCRSDILALGQDEKNRYMFSINFQAQRSGT